VAVVASLAKPCLTIKQCQYSDATQQPVWMLSTYTSSHTAVHIHQQLTTHLGREAPRGVVGLEGADGGDAVVHGQGQRIHAAVPRGGLQHVHGRGGGAARLAQPRGVAQHVGLAAGMAEGGGLEGDDAAGAADQLGSKDGKHAGVCADVQDHAAGGELDLCVWVGVLMG